MSGQEKIPNFQLATQTTIDLKIIQQQLDEVEAALLIAWRYMERVPHAHEHDLQISNAIDALLAIKKSLGLTSEFLPVKIRQNASSTKQVYMPKPE